MTKYRAQMVNITRVLVGDIVALQPKAFIPEHPIIRGINLIGDHSRRNNWAAILINDQWKAAIQAKDPFCDEKLRAGNTFFLFEHMATVINELKTKIATRLDTRVTQIQQLVTSLKILPILRYKLLERRSIDLLNAGSSHDALEVSKEAIALDYYNHEAWYLRGSCNSKLGQSEDAHKCNDHSIWLNPPIPANQSKRNPKSGKAKLPLTHTRQTQNQPKITHPSEPKTNPVVEYMAITV